MRGHANEVAGRSRRDEPRVVEGLLQGWLASRKPRKQKDFREAAPKVIFAEEGGYFGANSKIVENRYLTGISAVAGEACF